MTDAQYWGMRVDQALRYINAQCRKIDRVALAIGPMEDYTTIAAFLDQANGKIKGSLCQLGSCLYFLEKAVNEAATPPRKET